MPELKKKKQSLLSPEMTQKTEDFESAQLLSTTSKIR